VSDLTVDPRIELMPALVFHGAEDVRLEQVERPQCGPRDAIIAVGACGICGTDLSAFRHGRHFQPGQVMGHEFAGRVARLGDAVSDVSIGDRVAVLPYISCGECPACRRDRPHLCVRWDSQSVAFGLPGGFAPEVRVPDAEVGRNIHALADDLPFEHAALAEPLAVAVHAVRLGAPSPGERVIVTGLGPIGLLVVVALRAFGVADVVGADIDAARRKAAEQIGAVETVDPTGRYLRDLLPDKADIVFECSGASSLIGQALRSVHPGGSVVAVALYGEPTDINQTLGVLRELRLQGSFSMSVADFGTAVDLLNTRAFDADALVSDSFALTDVVEAFQVAARGGRSIKVMVTPD
jgi:(R,R)-butanediol dehydrogenase/meso-butanediol dehydrogenase/diacetyl reductase